MSKYVITAITSYRATHGAGRKVWLYWSREGGGWWQWSNNESWAKKFTGTENIPDIINCAKEMGPHWYWVEPKTVKQQTVNPEKLG